MRRGESQKPEPFQCAKVLEAQHSLISLMFCFFPWRYDHTSSQVGQILFDIFANIEANCVVHQLGEAAEHTGHVRGQLLLALLVEGRAVDGVTGLESLVHLHVERVAKEMTTQRLFLCRRQ